MHHDDQNRQLLHLLTRAPYPPDDLSFLFLLNVNLISIQATIPVNISVIMLKFIFNKFPIKYEPIKKVIRNNGNSIYHLFIL